MCLVTARVREQIKKQFKPDTIINIGDELDMHALSFHDTNPDLHSAGHELSLAKEYIKELENIFPEMTLLDSNHSSLIYRRGIKHGIPKGFLREYNDFFHDSYLKINIIRNSLI